MKVEAAQKDMRDAYLGGGSGVFVSGLVWLISGMIALFGAAETSIIVFFIAGIFIHPIGILIVKLFQRSGKHNAENAFGKLAMESTIFLFVGLFIVYSLFQTVPNWFYPIMLLIIGARYLIFQTIYGLKVYWILGTILMATGILCLSTNQPFHVAGILGGVIELIFSGIIIQKNRKFF